MRLAYYISDHGYGHATRSIAVIRALASEGNGSVSIEVLNHHAHGILRRSLRDCPRVTVLDRPTDVGFVCHEDRLSLDPGATALAVNGWIHRWKRFVAEESARLGRTGCDLILTDVAPEPLLVAEKLGIPSLVTSNFTWVDQYEPHLRADLLAPLRGSYALAERAHAYSMRTALAGVRQIAPAGLVTRQPSLGRREARERLGVGEGERLVHVGFGWAADTSSLAAELDTAGMPRDVRLLVSRNLSGLSSIDGWSGRIVTIAEGETEAQNYIAACDLVIAKAGYGTVAEAIAGRVPILAVPVEGSPESETIAETVQRLGIGIRYPKDPLVRPPLLDEGAGMLEDLSRYREAYRRIPDEYAGGAAARLARAILDTR